MRMFMENESQKNFSKDNHLKLEKEVLTIEVKK